MFFVKTSSTVLAAAFVAAFAFAQPTMAVELPVSRLVNIDHFASLPARRWRAYTKRVKYQDFKVFAISGDGKAYGMAWSFLSPEWAAVTALQRCAERRRDDTAPCALFAVGRQVLAGEPAVAAIKSYRQRMRERFEPARSAGVPVSEQKLGTHVTYRSFAGETRWGTGFKLRFRKDEVQFEQGWIAGVMGKGQLGVARWTVENDRLCFLMSDGLDPACYQVLEVGNDDAYLLKDEQGDVVATLKP